MLWGMPYEPKISFQKKWEAFTGSIWVFGWPVRWKFPAAENDSVLDRFYYEKQVVEWQPDDYARIPRADDRFLIICSYWYVVMLNAYEFFWYSTWMLSIRTKKNLRIGHDPESKVCRVSALVSYRFAARPWRIWLPVVYTLAMHVHWVCGIPTTLKSTMDVIEM